MGTSPEAESGIGARDILGKWYMFEAKFQVDWPPVILCQTRLIFYFDQNNVKSSVQIRLYSKWTEQEYE